MNYTEQLKAAAQNNGSLISLGLDPVQERLPVKGEIETAITEFYTKLLDGVLAENTSIGCVKPNYSFYAQYGFPGLRALQSIITFCRERKLPVILDAKRADIGKTSEASAREAFDFWKGDAVTIAPYMGSDSVMPFINYSSQGKGAYILVRTSNVGAVDLQNLTVDNEPLYLKTAAKVVEWHQPGTGAVVGATYPEELRAIADYFAQSGKEIPLLIPGVGAQGGSAADVVNALRQSGSDLSMHRINSSSAINYAYEKESTDDFVGAAIKAVSSLNSEIGFK